MPYYFNLPRQTELTTDQQLAVNETDSIFLSGGPGTGKSVVCLWRHIRNHELGKDSLLLTYTKTLEHYLKQSAGTYNSNAKNNIDRTYRWSYAENNRRRDEIIIDEAQDVECNRYEIIKNYADRISYGADEAQSLFPDRCCSLNDLQRIFNNNEEYTLGKNFRNSNEILTFTKSVFPNIFIARDTINNSKRTGIKPLVQLVGKDWDLDLTNAKIIEIVNEFSSETHNIGILLPSANQVNKYYNNLKDNMKCTKYEGEMKDFEELSNIHITTFKSAKGTEFDTVIIPHFDNYPWFLENTNNITEKDYYVALTRAKTNLFLICRFDLNISSNVTYEIE